MVMAVCFKALGYNVALAHCNFNLRGEESDGDEEFVKAFARENNIQFHTTRFDTANFAADAKLSIQMAARQLRYLWFDELLRENSYDYLLTAHHLDDQAETFLINFTRGTGLDGLTGIPQQNGKIVRPLLPFTRKEIEQYAQSENISWREDSSNASDKYLRNKLRHDVIPVLASLNKDFYGSLQQTISNLQQSQSLAQDAAVLVYRQVVSETDNQKHIDISQLLRLPNYKAYLYHWLNPLGFTAWDDIFYLTEAQSGKVILAPGYRLVKNRDVMILEQFKPADNEIYEIRHDEAAIEKPVKLKIKTVNSITKNVLKNEVFVDNQLIKFPLFVRKWQDGDYFYPFGMGGRKKKLSKYFKDEKRSLPEKEDTWVLCSGNDIVWVIGQRADERFKVTEQTTQILNIQLLSK